MANNILKLKVESSEYDQKLANAAKGIRHLADVAHKGAGELTGLEKSEVDYIKALGEMETKSRTASGQVRELSSTYKELKVVYDQLNEVEKADEGGKALAASLETLKQRAQEAKAQLDSATSSLNDSGEAGKGTSSVMEMLKDKFTINIDAIKLFNMGLQAAEGALSVAKDAFFASEATVDEWGRVMDSSKSLYEGFLTALNTGDISGYLGRIEEIVTAARKAYDELDRLGTMKTIQAPKMSAQQTENERMRMMIQTGRYIAPVDGRRASMKDGQLLTPEQIRRIEVQLQNGMKTVVSLVGNEVKQTGKAIDAVYNRQAQELGMSLKEFRKGTSSMDEFDKRMAGYDQYQKWREQHTTIDMQSGREIVARGNPFEQFAKWGTFRVDGDRYNDLVKLIQQRDQQTGQVYSMQSQAYRTMNRAEGVTLRQLMGGGSGGGSGRSAGGGGGIKEEKDDFEEIVGLIPNAQEAVRSLQQQISQSWDEGEIARLTEDLKEAQAELQRLQNIGKETKETPMVQGLSGFNQETMSAWMQGRQSDLSKAEYGSPDYSSIMGNIADMNIIKSILEQSVNAGINAAEFNVAPMWDKIFGEALPEGMEGTLSEALSEMYENAFDGMDIDDSAFEDLVGKINEKLKDMGIDPIEIPIKTVDKDVKAIAKSASITADVVGSIGDAFNAIEDPAAKVAGTVMQAIASIALGYAQATVQATSMGPWAWVAFAATGLATMLSTISAIHSSTGYAEGGMIKGNSYSGDNIGGMVDGGAGGFVGLNAGEIVLNKSQQTALASQLQGNGINGINLSGRIKGTDIILSVDRSLQLQGKQLLTWG